MKSIQLLLSKINLLKGQVSSIKDSGLFTDKEIERLTPQLVEHIRLAENDLKNATRHIEVKEALTVSS